MLNSHNFCCPTVTVIFDLRYRDLDLLTVSRETFVATVGEMFTISRATPLQDANQRKLPVQQRIQLLAVNGTFTFSVYDSVYEGDDYSSDVYSIVQRLTMLSPVQSSSDTDQQVMEVLQREEPPSVTNDGPRPYCIFFFTSFMSINNFSSLAHTMLHQNAPFTSRSWLSVHLDGTAFTTTTLTLSPTTRSVRCPIAPICIRTVLQSSLAPALRLDTSISVSIRYGRYTVPCVARRGHLLLPPRCCVADDLFKSSGPSEVICGEIVGGQEALVFCGASVCSSKYEHHRLASQEAVLTTNGILSAETLRDDMLYGDGWIVHGKESLSENQPSPETWMRHLADELRGDVLFFSTQQPLLDPPHQLALPASTIVGFFIGPNEMYLRLLVPPELRVERVESIAACGGNVSAGCRTDATLVAQIKKTADTLRAESSVLLLRKPAGVCRALSELRVLKGASLNLEEVRASSPP
ncbi:hypothetical protein TRVL_01312 [Trypanosoma vivax]|uniref:DUF7163 domain-containing protein n=1 Tax=Trypanosoma vivax (strain Y486) TaxID=1055687 RepID=G0TVB9_TRYVY|nr:hypothetical protein TRVL_01312 [Trypanosoma vivax]CCC47885.1 conserved hypothetical protein [Trypanosoma vivax Y486]